MIATLVLTVPAVVFASHQFNDVPDSNQFHNEISAIAGAGIAAGFGDGGFHPSAPVTRQAMAAFMERGLGHIVHDGQTIASSSVDVDAGSAFSPHTLVKELSITVPGASNNFGPTQVVYLHGRIELTGEMRSTPYGLAGCACMFGANLQDVTGSSYSPDAFATFETLGLATMSYSMVVDTVFVVPPGPRTFRLYVWLADRVDATNAASWSVPSTSTFTAMTFPFGTSVSP
ncbi:MAG: S-layer homology domain-containing protein [Candidatus Limnocylindrales bacterium]